MVFLYLRLFALVFGFALFTFFSGSMGCSGPADTTSSTFFPETCFEIQEQVVDETGERPDNGIYTLYVEGDEDKPWDAYCYNMRRSEPIEYLNVEEADNYSEVRNDNNVVATTSYRRLRIDPINLTINPLDDTFATSDFEDTFTPVFPVEGMESIPAGWAEVQPLALNDGTAAESNVSLADTAFSFLLSEEDVSDFFCQVDSETVVEANTEGTDVEVAGDLKSFHLTAVNTNLAGDASGISTREVADCETLGSNDFDIEDSEAVWPLQYGDGTITIDDTDDDATDDDTTDDGSAIAIESLTIPSEADIIADLTDQFDDGFIPGNVIAADLTPDNDNSYCQNQDEDEVFGLSTNVDYDLNDLPIWLEDFSQYSGFWIIVESPITIPDDVLEPILIEANCTYESDTSIMATRENIMLNDYDGDDRTDYFEYLHNFELIANGGTISVSTSMVANYIGTVAASQVPTALVSEFLGLTYQTNEDSTLADFDGDGASNAAEYTDGTNLFVASGEGSFAVNDSETSPALPDDLVAVDVDGDGDLDVAQTSFSDNKVAIYLNGGDGDFGNRSDVTVGTAPWGIVAVDLDADGAMDLITANYTSDNITILNNNGSGVFTTTSVNVGDAPAQLVAGDFDEDTNFDVAVTNFGNGSDGTTVSILLGDGLGGLALDNNVTVGTGPNHIMTADFDEDDHLDLVVTNRGANGEGTTASILLGNGDGTFITGDSLTTDPGPAGVAVADFNGDRHLDVVLANNHHDDGTVVGVYLGNGDGTFVDPIELGGVFGPYDVLAFDNDGDNDVDILVSDAAGEVSVFNNNGLAAFTELGEVSVGSATYEHFLSPGDFNADGKIDFVVSDFAGASMKFILND